MKRVNPEFDDDADTTEISFDSLQASGLPFQPGVASSLQKKDNEATQVLSVDALRAPRASATSRKDEGDTRELSLEEALARRSALPFAPSTPPAAPAHVPPTYAPPNPTLAYAQPNSTSSYASTPQPHLDSSPWAGGLSIGSEKRAEGLPQANIEPVRPATPEVDLRAAGYAGALAASNAAAWSNAQASEDAEAKARLERAELDQNKASPGEEIELIWFDPNYVSRVKKHPAWAPLLGPTQPKPLPRRGKPPPVPPTPEEASAAAEARISTILSRGTPSSQKEISPKRPAFEPRGTAMPALYLLAGTLVLHFDEVELLKETVKAATPLAAVNKKLEQAIAKANEILQMPLDGSPEIAEDCIKRLRDVWPGTSRSLPPDYLVTQAERAALQKRAYQRRTLLDDEWIRAALPEGPAKQTAPVYIPAKIDKRLPVFRSFPARIIVETLPKQDMYEVHSVALRVIALARVLGEST